MRSRNIVDRAEIVHFRIFSTYMITEAMVPYKKRRSEG